MWSWSLKIQMQLLFGICFPCFKFCFSWSWVAIPLVSSATRCWHLDKEPRKRWPHCASSQITQNGLKDPNKLHPSPHLLKLEPWAVLISRQGHFRGHLAHLKRLPSLLAIAKQRDESQSWEWVGGILPENQNTKRLGWSIAISVAAMDRRYSFYFVEEKHTTAKWNWNCNTLWNAALFPK